MQEVNFTVAKREKTGKGPNRRLRSQGEVPAVIYGPETDPILVSVNYQKLYRAMHGKALSTIINLDIEGDKSEGRKVLIRDLQKDPITGDLVHLDFHQIRLDRPITLTVTVHTEGIPIGVKDFGGIVQHTRRDIEISCLPTKIPEHIVVDISELNIGESVHVKDIQLDDVEILTAADRTIATVVAPTVHKETVAAAEGEEGEAAEGEEGAEGEEAKEGEEGEEKKEEKED